MRYTEEQIEEIRTANNIVDVIGASVGLRRTGSNYVGLCPFHNEKTPSFSVSASKQMYYCFGCHAGGNVITFVMEYYQYSFTEALQFLADRAGITLPKAEDIGFDKKEQDRKSRLFDIQKKAAAYYHYQLKNDRGKTGLEYFKKRGLSDDTILSFGLGYADKYSDGLYKYLKSKDIRDVDLKDSGLFIFDEKRGFTDKFWNRVMFPITDAAGKVIGFGGRVMGDGKPKYLNSPETDLFNKRRHLYALQKARRSRQRYMIVCEGYMDTISLHQAGFDNAVATLGTALTSEQAALLKRYTSDVRLLYDSDEAGVKAALRAGPILYQAGIRSRVVSLKPYKDPDELINAEGPESMERRLKEARDVFMFECDQLAGQYNMADPQDETVFQRELAAKLLRFTEEMELDNYIRACASAYNLSENALRKMVGALAVKGTAAEHYERPKETGRVRTEKVSPEVLTEKMMLTYLANHPEAFELTSAYVGPDDFHDGLCHQIAVRLYEQHERGQVMEASLLNSFTDSAMQQEVAGLFHTTLPVANEGELDRAFTDTVLGLMTISYNHRMNSWQGDADELMVLAKRKSELEQLKNSKMFHLSYQNTGDNI